MEDVGHGGYHSPLESIGIPLAAALRGLTAPRSIAEVRLREAEVSKLRDWARSLGPSAAEADLRSFQKIPAASCTVVELFGLVIFALIAEVTRRQAQDGQIWSVVRRGFRDDTQAKLFFQGQPNEFVKDALKFAAQRFELRNAFDLDNAQAWYLTSYLQFGITKCSLGDHLPRRLAGYELLPRPVELLLAGEQRSQSFVKLWEELGDYRRHNLNEDRLRDSLNDSPWFLPEWTDEVIESARRFPHLQRTSWPSADSVEYEPEDITRNLFSRPMLVWDGTSDPMFKVETVGLADLQLEDDEYSLLVPDDLVWQRLEFLMIDDRPSGLKPLRFSTDPKSASLVVALDRHRENAPPERITLEEIRLWNPLEGVALFDERGWALDVDTQLAPSKRYTLLISPDAQLEGRAAYRGTSHGVTAVRLDPVARDSLRVLSDQEVIWTAAGHQRHCELSENISAEIQGSYNGVSLGSPITVEIHNLPPDAQVTSIRVAGQAQEIPQRAYNVLEVPNIDVPQDRTGLQIDMVVRGVVDGQRFAARTSNPPPWKGVQVLTPSGWRAMDGDRWNLIDLQGAQIRVFTPQVMQPESDKHPTLFAGDRPVGRVLRQLRPQSLKNLPGYGEALTVRDDRYNASQVIYELSEAVTCTGIIADLNKVGAWDDTRIRIRNLVRFDPDRFKIHTLTELGHLYEAICVEPDEDGCWRVLSDPAVAWLITSGKEIVGQWWRDLPVDASDAELQDVALLARVGRAPLLEGKIRERARELVLASPWSVLECWTREVLTPFEEIHRVDDAWSAIARELLLDWHCPEDVSGFIDNQLASWDPDVFVATARHFPLVMARLLKGLGDSSMVTVVASRLCPGSTGDTLKKEVAHRLHVDTGFLDSIARQVADSVRAGADLPEETGVRSNIAVLCNVDADFRRWLATYLLNEAMP